MRRWVITTILMIHISCPTSSTKIILSLAVTLILRFIRKVLENFRILESKYFLELLLFFWYFKHYITYMKRENKWACTLKKKIRLHFLRLRFLKLPMTCWKAPFFYFPFSHLSTAQCWTKWFNWFLYDKSGLWGAKSWF